MSKYTKLWIYIQEQGKATLQLSFDEIGDIAGIPLDHSFLNCKRELPEYGYAVGKISLMDQTVIFHKLD